MNIKYSLLALPFVVLNATAQSQVEGGTTIDAGIDSNTGPTSRRIERRGAPTASPWIVNPSDDHYIYVAALQMSAELMDSIIGHEPNANDLSILRDANDKLAHVDGRALEYRARLCEQFEAVGANLENEELAAYGDDFNDVDVLIAEDVVSLYEDTLSKLTAEAAEALNQIRKNMHSSGSEIDFRKFAELSPDKMREEVMDSCR